MMPRHLANHDQEDLRWQQFLQKYQPVPPPPAHPVEAQIMAKIQEQRFLQQRQAVWLWGLVGLVVVVSGSLGLGQAWRTQQLSAMEQAELEAFVVEQWSGLYEVSEEPMARAWLDTPLTDSTRP